MSHPTGPRPIVRADGSTAYSTGAAHTLLIRVADRLRATRTITGRTDMASKYRTTEDDLTPQQRAERDQQIADARHMTDAELAEFTARGDAAWRKYQSAS